MLPVEPDLSIRCTDESFHKNSIDNDTHLCTVIYEYFIFVNDYLTIII